MDTPPPAVRVPCWCSCCAGDVVALAQDLCTSHIAADSCQALIITLRFGFDLVWLGLVWFGLVRFGNFVCRDDSLESIPFDDLKSLASDDDSSDKTGAKVKRSKKGKAATTKKGAAC